MDSPRLSMMGPPLHQQQQQQQTPTQNTGSVGVNGYTPPSSSTPIRNGMLPLDASRTPQRPTVYAGQPPVPRTPQTPTPAPRQPSLGPQGQTMMLGSPHKTGVDLGAMMGAGMSLKAGGGGESRTSTRGSSMAPAGGASASTSASVSATAITNANATAGPATPQQPPAAGPSVVPQVPPLPATVNLNPAVTRVSIVPLVDSLRAIPGLSEPEIADIRGWMARDRDYDAVFRRMKERMGEEVRALGAPLRAPWWERESAEAVGGGRRRGREVFDVRYPRSRKDRDGRERRKVGRREGVRLCVFFSLSLFPFLFFFLGRRHEYS